ncbi:MAG: hypothetical protein MUF87_04375 [Anaerolineae bacterium]|nr:hypothetical protein [Anaerolineae bacterium]
MTIITIRKVDSKADFKAFFEFPWQIYQTDPNWTPPLLSMRHELLDKAKNPAWEYMEGDYFTAWRGDQLVGTIAAFVNHRHNEFHGEQVAWFGAFECFNDVEVAQQLFMAAETWAKTRGYTRLRGPQTFTTHEDVGLLVDGFAPPVLLMPYHAAYYADLILQAGFQPTVEIYSYYYDWVMAAERNLFERFEKLTARTISRTQAMIRPINRKNLRGDFAAFKEIYNKAWVDNWGFVPMTEKELDALIEGLSLIFDPDLACFVTVNEEIVGFLIVVPDFNQVLHHAYPRPGEPELITLIKALWHWKIRPKITGSRTPLMGVLKEYRNKGLDLMMYNHVMKNLKRKGYQWVDCGWILDSNQAMRGVMDGIGMKIHRTYRLYEKSL